MELLPSEDPQLDRDALRRVASVLADQYAALYDARPADPRAELAGDILTFVFQGGLSRSDELLLQNGRTQELRAFRERFLRVVSPDLGGVVEQLTEQDVSFSQFGFDADSRTTTCLFGLRARTSDGREERAAVLNWSEQVRRNSHEIRARHRAARQAHRELTERMRDIRLGVPPRPAADDAPADAGEASADA